MSYKLFNKNRQKEKEVSVESTKIDNFRKALKINFPDNLREQIRRELEAVQDRLQGQHVYNHNWRVIAEHQFTTLQWDVETPATATPSDESVEDVNFGE
jgi:hypothetical protein